MTQKLPAQHVSGNVPTSINPKRRWRKTTRVLWLVLLGAVASVLAIWLYCVRMPGNTYRQSVSDVRSVARLDLRADAKENDSQHWTVQDQLRLHVERLASTIGERNLQRPRALNDAADFIEQSLTESSYSVQRQEFEAHDTRCFNLEAEILGTTKPKEIVLVCAHYDSVIGCPGANDNGSGTAALLVLAKALRTIKTDRTIRFVFVTNEEPPYFQTAAMGSWVYAKRCRQQNENLTAVISLETMGYFSDQANSQDYPAALKVFYPSTGNFIAFVANLGSRPLLHRAIKSFRKHAEVPSEGGSVPGGIPGIGWSDHWAFWQEGYQGIMITDTALFRYPHYHKATDTPDKLDYIRFGKTVDALIKMIEDLANENLSK